MDVYWGVMTQIKKQDLLCQIENIVSIESRSYYIR